VFGGDYPTPDGTCLRDYVHVTDLAQAHLLALARLESGAGSAVYNLGNGRPFSVRDVIRAVERVTGRLFASSARIRSDLGWSPAISSLEDIVDTAYRWRLAHPAGYGGEDSR